MFATDKKLRTLVIARIEKASTNEASASTTNEESKTSELFNDGEANAEATEDNTSIEIHFNLKVSYLGTAAHSIAFVKREPYQILDLKAAASDNMRHLSS